LVVRGRLGGLERKTSEPIAIEAGLPRKPVQVFVGSGKWGDEGGLGGVGGPRPRGRGGPRGGGGGGPQPLPPEGDGGRGGGRAGGGRGRADNCEVGVFRAYAAGGSSPPLARRLSLPEDWAGDEARREKCHVPLEIAFREKWQIALELLDRGLPGLAHGWIVGD